MKKYFIIISLMFSLNAWSDVSTLFTCKVDSVTTSEKNHEKFSQYFKRFLATTVFTGEDWGNHSINLIGRDQAGQTYGSPFTEITDNYATAKYNFTWLPDATCGGFEQTLYITKNVDESGSYPGTLIVDATTDGLVTFFLSCTKPVVNWKK